MMIISKYRRRMTLAAGAVLLLLAVAFLSACDEQRAASATSAPTYLVGPDQEAYRSLLSERVNPQGLVDYRGLKADRKTLDRYVTSLARVDPGAYANWSNPQKIAFWINAYNGLTLKEIVDHYPIRKGGLISGLRFPESSIRQIPGVWDEVTNIVMGRPVTLDHIEHEILRKQFHEPRIHMALVCAAMGCPPLRNEPYTGSLLDEQLENQAQKFFTNSQKFRIDRTKGTVYLSSIFKWFGPDFAQAYGTGEFQQAGADLRPVLNFAGRHLNDEGVHYLKNERYAVEYLDYDWSLNEDKRP